MKPIEKIDINTIKENDTVLNINLLIQKINELVQKANIHENDIKKLWDQQPI